MTMARTEGSELRHITPSGIEAGIESQSRISVLYVDETPDLLDAICRCLERSGEMMVDTALSIEDALNKMRYISYDVIVTDYNFKDGSANTLLRCTREKGDKIPFVYFTLFQVRDLEDDAMGFGGVSFIGKPALYSISPFSDLYQAIKKAARVNKQEKYGFAMDPARSVPREHS
jgi:DNA-binding NtrC family response regulator